MIRSEHPDTSVKPRTRRIVTVVILAVLATLLTAAVGTAEANASTGTTCYGQGVERVASVFRNGDVLYTSQIMVTIGSPCSDINIHGITANGVAVCRTVRVRWGGEDGTSAGPWVWNCGSWAVLWHYAVEGRVFVVETWAAQGPAMVAVRS